MRKYFFVLLALSFKASQGFSWGSFGHQAIALIAEQNLTENSKKTIKDLLANETISEGSIWPDQIKNDSDWNHTRSYHFVNIKDNDTYLNSLKSQTSQQKIQGDIVRALVESENVLRNLPSRRNNQNQTYALKFMIHFIGDLHQPLHAGRMQDLGGNSIKVSWFNQKTNLHSIWDTMMLMTYLQSAFKLSNYQVGDDLQTYLDSLRKPTQIEISNWQNSYIDDWFKESYKLRESAYSGDANQSKQYYANRINIVNEQILKAGFRLASWLNTVFSNVPLSNQAQAVRKSINQIIDTNKFKINLTPQKNISKEFYLNNILTVDISDPCLTHSHH